MAMTAPGVVARAEGDPVTLAVAIDPHPGPRNARCRVVLL